MTTETPTPTPAWVRPRVSLVIEFSAFLDMVPGEFATEESWKKWVTAWLTREVGHYDPKVSFVDAKPAPSFIHGYDDIIPNRGPDHD